MTKPTTQEKVDALIIVNAMIERYLAASAMYESDGTVAEIQRIQKQLETRKQKLLDPPTRKPSKPKLTLASGKITGSTVHFEPDAYENSMPRTGKNNRNG